MKFTSFFCSYEKQQYNIINSYKSPLKFTIFEGKLLLSFAILKKYFYTKKI